MKIIEIIEDVQIKTNGLDISSAHDEHQAQYQQIGKGGYATVYKKPGNIPQAVKISRFDMMSPETDGYFQYIDQIRKIQHNPFVPKLYEIIIVHPNKEKSKYPYLQVTSEVLTETLDISSHNLKQIIESISKPLTNQYLKIIEDNMKFNIRDKEGNYIENEVCWMLSDVIRLLLVHTIFSTNSWITELLSITNQSLLEVLNIIKNLNNFNLDLGTSNFMVRNNTQLVITDPLSSKK